jgi:hypothetical protein
MLVLTASGHAPSLWPGVEGVKEDFVGGLGAVETKITIT